VAEKKLLIIWWCDYCRKYGVCSSLSDWTATMTSINSTHRNSTPDCAMPLQSASAIVGIDTTQDVLKAVKDYERVQ